jgi:uncharacterized phage-associated protein
MKQNYLNILAKEILACSVTPVTKVRFAKIIYFVYKSLILTKFVDNQQIAFIRMPLGPVADGFMDLSTDKDIEITTDNIGLLYNREKYSLKSTASINTQTGHQVQRILSQLENISTSKLVAISHMEPSWINNSNGQKYYIGPEDLALSLPMSNGSVLLDEAIDNQLIQSKLVSGMIDEIVMDSSALEHPEHYSN